MTAYLLDINGLKKRKFTAKQLAALKQHRYYYSGHILYQYLCQISGSLELSYCKRVLGHLSALNAQPITYTRIEIERSAFGLSQLETQDPERVATIQEMISEIKQITYAEYQAHCQNKFQKIGLYPFPDETPSILRANLKCDYQSIEEEAENYLEKHVRSIYLSTYPPVPIHPTPQQFAEYKKKLLRNIALSKGGFGKKFDAECAIYGTACNLNIISEEDFYFISDPYESDVMGETYEGDTDSARVAYWKKWDDIYGRIFDGYTGVLDDVFGVSIDLRYFLLEQFVTKQELYTVDVENFIYMDQVEPLIFLTNRRMWTQLDYSPSMQGRVMLWNDLLANL